MANEPDSDYEIQHNIINNSGGVMRCTPSLNPTKLLEVKTSSATFDGQQMAKKQYVLYMPNKLCT